MAMYKTLPINLFRRGILIFIGTHEMFKKWVKDYFKDDTEFEDLVDYIFEQEDTNVDGTCWFNGKSGDCIIELPKFPKTPDSIAAASHEALHATFNILNYCSIEFTPGGSNETFTYLLQYIIKHILIKEDYINY